MKSTKFLILVCIFVNVAAEIINDPTICGRTKCKVPTERKFKYKEEMYYRYRYSVDVNMNLGGTLNKNNEPKNESTLYLDSMVSLKFTSPCEGELLFYNSSLSHDRSQYNPNFPDRAGGEFQISFEQYPLKFAFDDGLVREVCPHPEDPVWSTNLKRGVLSMLQNTMKRFDIDRRSPDELDINGICDTTYRLHEARKTSLIIRKNKHLDKCNYGAKHLSIVQSNAYKSPLASSDTSRFQAHKLLDSSNECEITIDHNVYDRVVCWDKYRLIPLSNGEQNSVRTSTTSNLKLIEETNEALPEEFQRKQPNDDDEEKQDHMKRTTLLYDHAKNSQTVFGELRTTRELLKKMCQLGPGFDELQKKFAEMFTAFVHSARFLDHPSLFALFTRANNICNNGKKHIVNALPYMGSNAGVRMMKDLIMKKYVDSTTSTNWITTFALIPRPDYETIKILAPLLDIQEQLPEAQFILSYSALIHAYCTNKDINCINLDPISNFLKHLEEKLSKGCSPRTHSTTQIKETLEGLKAIGNMGLQTETTLERLKQCYDDPGDFLPMEIRVAAIDAHRRLPSCEKTRDQVFLDRYRNFTLDSEIRIASYLQVMRCPDYNVIKVIKHTLKVEEVNQVGSYVWSHLTNLYSSSSPTRIEIQSLLTDRDLGNKFNSDLRKFSRNYDGSFFSEEYNFGANYQGDVIFSPKSYIPRTATLNFTLDLFGESVNVFEVTTRMEGLEYYAESIFGPDGPYNGEKVSGHLKNFLRRFRSAPEENEDYWKRVKRLPNVIDNNFLYPKISLSYKIFGNELKYIMLNGNEDIKTALANLNPWSKIKQILSGREIHYEDTVMFLDSDYVVPTTVGLPIRLELTGSAACKFKLSGSLNAQRLASHGEVEVIGNIRPSMSVDVVGSMTVNAFYKSIGIKLRTNLYSTGAAEIQMNMKGLHLARLSLGLPNHQMEIFSLQTDILMIKTNGAEVMEQPIGVLIAGQQDKHSKQLVLAHDDSIISNTTCSWPALDRLIGLKFCLDYQFPNITKNSNAPYFLLNGPTLLQMSLIKADPTAKSYLFEYKWDRTPMTSVIRVAFDTPGSQVKREMSAMISFDARTQNVSVMLHSTGNSLIANGTYKNTENEVFIDVGFDVNGTNHLDAHVGYVKKPSNNGYTYIPQFHLTINSERVAAISGSIRNTHKSNISQCHMDLTFQTKKVWSKFIGYIVKRNVNLEGDFKLDYQTQKMTRKETIHLELSLKNQSLETSTRKSADLKLHSTAYPQLNTVINAWYDRTWTRLELHLDVNTNPHLRDDRYKLTAQFIATYSKYYFQNQGSKVSVLFSITKPIQNLDIKLGVNHYSMGIESKTNFVIGYAPGKEITLYVNKIMPRGLLFAIEASANLTIPNFNSLILEIRINERSKREYELDFAGTWFSGHNMTARGTYVDKSTAVVISHNLKLVIESPSLSDEILINCKLYHDANDLKMSMSVDQVNVAKYALIINHSALSPTLFNNFIEGRYKNNVYSLMTTVDVEHELRMELHLDKWRDVHLILIGINEEDNKEFGIEFKWDANRDPSMKVVSMLKLNKIIMPGLTMETPSGKELNAVVTVSYPGRVINGACVLSVSGQYNHMMDLTIDWNPDKVVRLYIEIDYNMSSDSTRALKFESQLVTPFEQWKKTALDLKYEQTEKALSARGNVYWKDCERVETEFDGSISEENGTTEYVGNYGLKSTIHSIKWITGNLTHKLINFRTADTRLLIKYHPAQVIDARSIWHLDKESDTIFNLTGILHLESPVVNYKKGDMKCQLRVLPNWRFDGVASLDLDRRKYTASLIGDLAKLKESKINFNITTPMEKYSFLRGKFGLSESERHIVAEIVSPAGPLGFEVICQFFTTPLDFNVKLQLATPIDILQRALLIAKLNKREADFRAAYNNMTVGFQGVWHYHNITDFHYSYIIYTPIHGFHECGGVAKLIILYTDPAGKLDVDTEFFVRLAEIKVGLRARGGPKFIPIRLPVQTIEKMSTQEDQVIVDDDNDDDDDENDDTAEENELDKLHWRGELEICAAVIDPIVGELDIDNEGSLYKVSSLLKLPQGKITLDDRFFMEDVFHMKNDLNIETPFLVVSEINSNYLFNVDEEHAIYLLQMDFNVKSNSTWVETGIDANYTYQKDDIEDLRSHTFLVGVKTPLYFMKSIDTKTIVELDENLYKANVQVRGEECLMEFFGSLELEDHYVDALLSTKIDNPVFQVPRSKISVKKDFTDKEKHLKFVVTIEEPHPKTSSFEGIWNVNQDYAKVSISLDTWLKPLDHLQADLLYSNTIQINNSAELNVSMKHHNIDEYKLISNLSNNTINASIYTPMFEKQHFAFKGDLIQLNEQAYKVVGELKNLQNDNIHKVNSEINLQSDTSYGISTVLESDRDTITITFDRSNYGLNLTGSSDNFNGTLEANLINALNWDLRTHGEIKNQDNNDIDQYELTTYMNVQVSGNTTLHALVKTPWREMKKVGMNGNLMLTNNSGDIRLDHHLNDDIYYIKFIWKLIYMVDMFGKVNAGYKMEQIASKDLAAQVYFKNPSRSFRNADIGFDIDIDHQAWKFSTNATVGFRNEENIDAVVVVHLPPPDNDDHRFLISYHSNKGLKDASYVVGYNTLKGGKNYASDGSLRMAPRDIDGHLRFTWGMLPSQSINNLFNFTFEDKEIELKYSLYTPKYLQEETLVVLFNYDGASNLHNYIHTDVFYPARERIGTASINYASLVNVNGTVNISSLIPNIPHAGCNFIVLTTLKQNKRFAEFFWPNNTALLNSDYSYHSEKLDSNLDGIFQLEIPLSTRHVGHFTYGYKKRPLTTTGYSVWTYNRKEILHGRYNSKSESRAGFEKDHIQIKIENIYKPIGIVYINQYEYSGGNEGTNYPTIEFKQVNVYRLDNSTFNIVGESRVETTHTGQDIQLKAVHLNRTVQFKTDYEILSGEFDQNTWLSLADDAWISYHINILNKTTDTVDNQFIVLSLAYPRRNYTLDGSYKITSNEINSEAKLDWDQTKDKPRTVGASFNWRNVNNSNSMDEQEAIFSLKHPSFRQPVQIIARLLKENIQDLLNTDLVINYSQYHDKLFKMSALLRDESDLPLDRRYMYQVFGTHPSTRFDLDLHGFVHKHSMNLFEMENEGNYKRAYNREERGQLNGRINVNDKEVLFHRVNNELIKHFNARYYAFQSKYAMNGSIMETPELNATWAMFLDPRDKLTWMMVNYTPDAIESLRMYGKIPDARSANFDIWRTYDQDLTVSDIAFYLKLNHSRLVTSALKWRPDLKSDIINTIKSTASRLYDGLNKDTDYWKQYVKSETIGLISDVWDDAQGDLNEFLDDWNNLKELETDFEDLKIYLNDSYNANDFYIKDIVGFGMYVIDELSLRSHIQSLPNILNEIWEIMGESGEAVRKSLLWIIETVKNAYNKASEIITAVLKGDSINQVAKMIGKLIEKYDILIKDLHVSFIKYIENLWNKIWFSVSQQWNRFLKLVEPIFIRVIHYLETVVWKASKEVVDFLYDRRKDIIASPYFDRFTNFTHDIDRFYKDIKANDIVTNVQKYVGLAIQFLKERYFTFVPFGEELKDVIDEIISEIKELKKLPSLHYALDKLQQVYERANYMYEYLGVKNKIETAIRWAHSKLMDISQTALQAENKYREAKTKFIFDPHQGLMCLEQKLPMSWHAFNQTPEFQEIPEYRAIADMGSYFAISNTTFWSLYYQFKPYTDPSNWLPPFRAQAMIVGPQHYVTFDGRHFDFVGSCTYLLSRDFVRNTFAILIKYNGKPEKMTHQLIVLIGNNIIELDVFEDKVELIRTSENSTNIGLQMPLELDNGTAYVYQEDSIVTVEYKNNQFRLECNLKFDLCTLELSGWYYGKTAGLLGTMDNEKMNDIIDTNGRIVQDISNFAHSWVIDPDNCFGETNMAKLESLSSEKTPAYEFCEDLFVNKTSEFNACFNVIDPSDFAKTCFVGGNESSACTIALSYIQICTFHEIHLRIPDRCTSCNMIDGTQIAEGQFKRLEGDLLPQSTDLVFIVEAKECNRGIKENRSIEQLVTQLNKELRDQQLMDNRWSLVVFGGDGVFDTPRSIILDGKIFTNNVARFINYFDYLPIGHGNEDIFAAISFASYLHFRAGVSKTFILMPCSHCESENQSLDYSIIHQWLLEHDITLHILMDGDFHFDKERLNKMFYGLDASKSYTKKDARILIGDTDLRRQVKLSKSDLGYCTPLSLETNGTIFSGNKLRFDRLASIKKFASVFSKRVALTARPNPCQHCECIADNNGMTQMECVPCDYPTPIFVDYVNETFNESMSALQSLDVDYGQIDAEDD